MSAAALNLLEQQARNRRATMMWVVLFVLFFAWLGFGGDAVLYFGSIDAAGTPHYVVPFIGLGATLAAAVAAYVSFRKGPQQVLWSTHARELTAPASPEERQLLNVVEEMAIAAGLPRPRVFIVDDPDSNAFATGRDPASACIAVTTGLLQTLNREELQGVVGHEMGHVRNLDIRLMTLIAALVGVVVLLSDGVGRSLRSGVFGGGGGRSGGRGKSGGAAGIALVLLVVWLITLVLAPFITRLMAMAVSRNREYLADVTGAELTRNPGALASALQKIDSAAEPTKAISRGTAHLCIADPLGRSANSKEGRLADWFGTHPPMVKRIAILKGMSYQQAKAAGESPAS